MFFNSCAVVNSLLGFNECAKEGCNRRCADNCDYCTIHCDSYNLPSDFDEKIKKSVDGQVNRYNTSLDKNNK